jgi:hypothetical protein
MKTAIAIVWCAYMCAVGLFAQTPSQLVERVWYDGDRPQRVWMAPDEVGVILTEASPESAEAVVRQIEPGAVLRHRKGTVAFFRIPDAGTRAARLSRLKQAAAVRHASPVFYETPEAQPENATILTGEIIVVFREGQAHPDELAQRRGMRVMKPLGFVPNAYLFDARAADDALTLANAVRRDAGVAFAYPNWTRNVVAR